jgi:hypothetical protein
MELVKKAETALADVYKGAPKLSDKTKETLVKIWPILALIFGVLQVWAAWGLWDLTRRVDSVVNYLGTYVTTAGYGYSGKDKFFIYLGILSLLVDGVILLMAYPKLKKRQKGGWDLIFLGSLINVAYSVVNLFISGRGFGSFLMSLIGSAIGFYLVFQVRDKYKGAAVKTVK